MMSIITKRSWKIRFSFIFVFIPVFLFLSACSLRHTSPLPLNERVVHLLEIMGYHDCNILSLADYETLATQYEVSLCAFFESILVATVILKGIIDTNQNKPNLLQNMLASSILKD